MNFKKILPFLFASALLFNVACTDENFTDELKTEAYENGILIANEGGYSTPTSEVSFVSNDLSIFENKIYGNNNNKEILGNVLQTIGFNGENAYLVSNVPNKIDIVNRFNFKKQTTVTTNLDNPRYIAFSGSQYFVTNNNFFNVMKLNVYNTSNNSFVTSIDFPRSAEKVVEANGRIVVQTDGVTYQTVAPYGELPTGYSLTIVNPSTNAVATTLTLPSNGIIRDLISYNGDAYVLASSTTASYIYKVNTTAGTFTTTTLTLGQAQKLRIDGNRFYFNDSSNKIYAMDLNSTTTPTAPIVTTMGNLYGFNVIDGKIYTSDASFTGDSKVNIYNTSGNLLKTLTTGIATNGFYKN
ncbi:hypothetical protein CHRY9390_00302 [Chryseobacterium aquaeductus]|uniref:Uncharacterized protein n=1 Tax=Chryseobacterium aquaeductus TaxID=2675056 RepID=A0A9N8MFG5_9FLAO|nr:hypothetical protein [Chryseobacterium aquaeductus]CAA7329661.1 hypothetical protein CHRY9390_00302 [Chryseobacterium potabilaquae]CAD7798222.1 hypothetical protein CHRY9390_00302 [Chryseobacterium aquaeductus]